MSLIPYGVLAMQVGAFVLLLGLVFARSSGWIQWTGTKALVLAFLATLAAVFGSLFYSDVIGFIPCSLCWWQRIFIYPQLVIFGVALLIPRFAKATQGKNTYVFWYSLPLSIVGSMIAIYQILLPYLTLVGIDCGATGVSCTKQYVLAFGYITIPVMSLTVFAILILLAIASKYKNQSANIKI